MRNCPNIKIMLLATLSATCLWPAVVASAPNPEDKHYNKIGFFDVHVCNWPNQPLFLMPLISTTHYDDIEKVDVFYPDGRQLAELNLSRFRILEPKDAPKKRVFINQLGMPDDAVDGWYSARITLKNGEVHTASDYVVLSKLGVQVDRFRLMKRRLPLPRRSSPGTRYPALITTRYLSATSGKITS